MFPNYIRYSTLLEPIFSMLSNTNMIFDLQFAIRRFSSGLNNQNVNIEIAYDTYVASIHVVFK